MNFPSDMAISRWRPAAWLQVTGSDAATFLQGQFTNDIRHLGSASRYGLWLNVKGKVVADSFVVGDNSGEVFWIGSYACPAAVIQERLEGHIIADDVTINDQSARWAGVTVFAADAAERVNAARAPGEPGFVFPGRRTGGPHVEWVMPADALDAALTRLGAAVELDAADVSRHRIEARIPLVPVDIGPGDLPNEGGLESVAISYQKGCYLGQEVMARLKSMGQIRRRLLLVRGPAAAVPPCPAPLFADTRQVGELRSAATTAQGDLIGLALLTLHHLKPGVPLGFDPAGEARLEWIDAP